MSTPDNSCGGRPRLVAVGIAPLGIISIGVVPMGVVSIGVVPMGVLSVGAVGMGLVNACAVGMGLLVAGINVMGVWWVGMEGMGPFRLGGPTAALHHQAPPLPANNLAYPSREEALRRAKQLGCRGVHPMGSLWMPCEHHPEP
ncbi:MAG: hypothetical protein VKI83_05655 [Synechococcaceae cyanobacterium]|nr:hypothetical protein [Synechococcaceae cyanobacterium]